MTRQRWTSATASRTTIFAICCIRSVTAILVAPSSSCEVSCGNVLTSTSPSDITCGDSSYTTSYGGSVFESCINCELSSKYYSPTSQQSDLGALLYNLRYATSTCLFGFPGNLTSVGGQCVLDLSCGALVPALQYGNFSSSTDVYGYCSLWSEGYVAHCEQCLQNLGNENYISNFITILDAACQQTPANGSTLTLQGSLFSETPIAIASPTPSNIASYTPPSTGGLSLGARVGIAVGAIVGLLVLAGCVIICNGKRRRRTHLQKLAEANRYTSSGVRDAYHDAGLENSPGSQSSRQQMIPVQQAPGQPLPWQSRSQAPQHFNKSPISTMSEPAYFSPYSSQYNSPVSPIIGRQWTTPFATAAVLGGGGGNMTGSGTGEDRPMVFESQVHGDSIEMSQLVQDASERDRWGAHGETGMSAVLAPVIATPTPYRDRGHVGHAL